MDCDKLAELVYADWPLLEELHLSELLDADSVNMLIGEQRPQLQILEIRNSNLDDTMMHLLAKADWPSLEYLELHGLSQMTDQEIRHLLRAGCLLIRCLLCGAFLHSWHISCLLAKQWPQLQFLNLGRTTRRRHESIPRSLPEWLQIKKLHLANAGLNAHAVKLLSSGQIVFLQTVP